jgi:hypothetical protein
MAYVTTMNINKNVVIFGSKVAGFSASNIHNSTVFMG